MRYSIAFLLVYLIMNSSCLTKNKKLKDEGCLPGIIMIGYIGENSKPVYPLVMRTNETDSSYLELIGFENEKFRKTGIITSKEYYRLYTLKREDYRLIKSYIKKNDTNNEQTIFDANQSAMKIILLDKCDSITYTVDKTNKGFFSKMIDTLGLKEEDELGVFLKYYHEIQEWDSLK